MSYQHYPIARSKRQAMAMDLLLQGEAITGPYAIYHGKAEQFSRGYRLAWLNFMTRLGQAGYRYQTVYRGYPPRPRIELVMNEIQQIVLDVQRGKMKQPQKMPFPEKVRRATGSLNRYLGLLDARLETEDIQTRIALEILRDRINYHLEKER